MSVKNRSQQERVDGGIGFDWDLLPDRAFQLSAVDQDATVVAFHRERNSHRGIAEFLSIETLHAYSVNQDFLSEIGELKRLRTLRMEKVTATDLTPLAGLPKLRGLVIDSATKVEDLRWVETLVSLRSLGLENLKRVRDLSPIGELKSLTGLGVEGSMWTPMRVETLAPLARLRQLTHLFMTNLRSDDRSLAPLCSIESLKVLQCANFWGADEFRRLRKANPTLRCDWLEALGQ